MFGISPFSHSAGTLAVDTEGVSVTFFVRARRSFRFGTLVAAASLAGVVPSSVASATSHGAHHAGHYLRSNSSVETLPSVTLHVNQESQSTTLSPEPESCMTSNSTVADCRVGDAAEVLHVLCVGAGGPVTITVFESLRFNRTGAVIATQSVTCVANPVTDIPVGSSTLVHVGAELEDFLCSSTAPTVAACEYTGTRLSAHERVFRIYCLTAGTSTIFVSYDKYPTVATSDIKCTARPVGNAIGTNTRARVSLYVHTEYEAEIDECSMTGGNGNSCNVPDREVVGGPENVIFVTCGTTAGVFTVFVKGSDPMAVNDAVTTFDVAC